MIAVSRDPDALMREAFPLQQAGDHARAEALCLEILELDPAYADAFYLLGTIHAERGDLERAIALYERAIDADPQQPVFRFALAQQYLRAQRWADAAAQFDRAHAGDPGTPESWNNAGLARQELGEFGAALACFERALSLAPDFPPALNNGGNVLREMGRIEDALEWLRRLCEVVPDNPSLHSNYLFTLNLSQDSREEIAEEHRAYGARFAAPLRRPRRALGAGERLRIAYFSPDLRAHPVAAFLEPVLANHDRTRFEIHGIHLHEQSDTVTERLSARCEGWIEASGLDDASLAQSIEDAGIDILVDLAGHTSHNRLPVMALQPAPVQATWLGYLGTTGLPAVEFRITDETCDPPGAERYGTETLKRLPHGHSCYQAPGLAIAVSPLPALSSGAICFGSFNKSSKLNEPVLSAWAQLLAAVPRSRLLIVGAEGEQQAALRAALAGKGVAPGRLELVGRTPLEPMLGLHARVDIALDPWPYNGVTTTFNSLWMGVPVLALAGEGAISRSAASILANLGMGDWVARSPDELVAIGAAKAADIPALAALRAGLRGRLEQSPLMDGARFTRALERIYLEMWQS